MNRLAQLRPSLRAFATAVEHEPVLRPVKRVIDFSPLTTDSFKELNKVYSIPLNAKDSKAIEVLPASIVSSIAELGSNGLLLRKQTKELWDELLAAPNATFLLDGPKGMGKSSTLLQLACAIAASKEPEFLLLYLPRLAKATAGYYPYYANKEDPCVFEQPELASDLLSLFRFLNEGKLTAEVKEALDPRIEPIKAFTGLLKILTGNSKRIVLAIDQFNALYCPTQYKNTESMTLVPENFSVLSALKKAIGSAGPSTSVIASICHSDPLIRSPVWDPTAKRLVNATKTLVPFDGPEVSALLAHYKAVGHSYKSSDKYTDLIRFVSGGIPSNIAKACNYETIYTA